MGLATGSRLGPYEILGLLGAGGMGEVYQARDPRLGRTVAIKVLPDDGLASTPDRLRRLEREARAAGGLSHPNILAVYDIGTQEGTTYIVSELLEGETLREWTKDGVPPVRKVLEHAIQIAEGLAAAHARGIVHRDLKPDNVFVTRDGRVKILDFGLAKVGTMGETHPASRVDTLTRDTLPGTVLGTIGYMSPEQVRGHEADHRSDIFSFGALLYELLSGRRAFRGDTVAETMTAILKQDPPDLLAGASVIPPGADRIVRRCLEKQPEERFQSASDLAFALDAVSEASGASARPPTALEGGRPRLRLALSLAALAIATLGFFAFTRARSPGPEIFTPVRFRVTLPDGVTPAQSPTTNSMALSPDGRQLVLVGLTKGQTMLWLRPLDRIEATALQGTEGATSPFWSPDGAAIGFFAGGKLKKIVISGGPAETLCEAEFGNAGAWGADGTVLFTEWAGEREGLYRISSQGGTPSAVALRTTEGPETGVAWPAFLGDGRNYVYLSGAFGRRPARMIAVASLDSSEARHVAPADSQPVPVAGSRLVFLREGTLLVQAFDAPGARLQGDPTPVADLVWFLRPTGSAQFTASPNGRALAFRGPLSPSRLAWLDRNGHEVGTVGPPAIITGNPALSPDGKRAAFTLAEPRSGSRDVWVHDLVRNVRSRVTLDPLDAVLPVWGPDGEHLLFGSASQGGPLQMRIRRADGSGSEEVVLQTNRTQLPQDWSADGKLILFGDVSPARRPPRQLWLVPLEGDRHPRPLESVPVSRYDGRFSPDGHRVAFVSEETGRPEIFIASLRGSGRRQQVSLGGGSLPRWRGDGRELFYVSPDGRLMAALLGADPDAVAATPRVLFTIDDRGEPGYDVEARGERFLFNLERGGPPPIDVATGWSAVRKD